MPTARLSPAPVVLVIGCPPDLVNRCREAAIAGQALVVDCDVQQAATLAAATWALAMVMLEDVYAFDAKSFNALAADVRARIVVLADDNVPQADLESMIVGAILDAEAARESIHG
jgi:hypothetical protein